MKREERVPCVWAQQVRRASECLFPLPCSPIDTEGIERSGAYLSGFFLERIRPDWTHTAVSGRTQIIYIQAAGVVRFRAEFPRSKIGEGYSTVPASLSSSPSLSTSAPVAMETSALFPPFFMG